MFRYLPPCLAHAKHLPTELEETLKAKAEAVAREDYKEAARLRDLEDAMSDFLETTGNIP